MGWQYEKACLQEWGLPPSAFSYSPQELMVASSYVLVIAVLIPILAFCAINFAGGLFPTINLTPLFVDALTLAFAPIGLVTGFLLLFGPLLGAVYSFMCAFAMAAALLTIDHDRRRRPYLASILVFLAVTFAYLAPLALGADQARHHRSHPDALPQVHLLLTRSLHPETERTEGDTIRSGPWRVIRVNSGRLWLAPDEDAPSRVVQIDLSDIATTIYLPD